jgi:hypothetical protein
VGVNIDEARHDQLAARIDRLRGAVRRNIGADRGYAAGSDRHVADRIDPQRGIDHATALDNEIIGRCRRLRRAGEDRRACGGCLDEPAPGQHDVTSHVERNLVSGNACLKHVRTAAKHAGRYWAGDVAMSTNARGGQRAE